MNHYEFVLMESRPKETSLEEFVTTSFRLRFGPYTKAQHDP